MKTNSLKVRILAMLMLITTLFTFTPITSIVSAVAIEEPEIKSIADCTIEAIADETYDGNAKEPVIVVKDGEKTLTITTSSDNDYSVEYEDNTNAGTAKVIVKGLNDYTGTKEATFRILPKTITRCTVNGLENKDYTGKPIEPVTITDSARAEAELVKDEDYTITYSNNLNAGTATMTIVGIGNYAGEITDKTFTIVAKDISTCTITDIPNQIYTGKPITPGIEIKNGDVVLEEGVDYTLEYASNTNTGTNTATITITAKGNNYTSSTTKNFSIVKRTIKANCEITGVEESYTYTGSPIEPEVVVKDGNTVLTKDKDYTLTYSRNTDKGNASVKVAGKNGSIYYSKVATDSKTISYAITAKDIADADVTIEEIPAQKYTGDTVELPAGIYTELIKYNGNKLVKDTDFTLNYTSNVEKGTAIVTIAGKGNYTGTIDKTFKIVEKSVADCEVSLSNTSLVYTGSELKPEVAIRDGAKTLVQDTDYIVEYKNNVNVCSSEAEVIVKGLGAYEGTIKTKTFSITERSLGTGTSYTDGIVVENVADQTYTGDAITPKVVVIDNGITLEEGRDYTLGYGSNINVSTGTATITITGAGNYNGSITKTFDIVGKVISEENDFIISEVVDPQKWTGNQVKPVITVTEVLTRDEDGNVATTRDLVLNTSYKLEYENNIEIGKNTAKVIVVGMGNYQGRVEKIFTIEKTLLPEMANAEANYAYTGKAIEPVVVKDVVNGVEVTLTEGIDYTITYTANIDVATVTATITAVEGSNYVGKITKAFGIVKQDINEEPVVIEEIPAQAYTGAAIEPKLTIMNGDVELKEGIDYTLKYENNISKSKDTAKITITPIGNYKGTNIVKKFDIVNSMNGFAVEPLEDVAYTGEEIKQPVVVTDGTNTLEENADYIVEYSEDCTNAGIVTIKVTGMGEYAGTLETSYEITKVTIEDMEVSIPDQIYNTAAIEPAIELGNLELGKDYVVNYINNVDAGKAAAIVTGTGNYEGMLTIPFTITPVEGRKCSAKMAKTQFAYTTEEQRPAVVVMCGTLVLEEGKDYVVSYPDSSKDAGKYQAIVTFIGNFTGTKTLNYTITPVEGRKCSAKLSRTSYVYNGKVRTPVATVKCGTTVLEEGKDYTVSYAKGRVKAGKYEVVVKFKGNFTGTKTMYFTIK